MYIRKKTKVSFPLIRWKGQVPMRAWIIDRVLSGSIGRIGERKKKQNGMQKILRRKVRMTR